MPTTTTTRTQSEPTTIRRTRRIALAAALAAAGALAAARPAAAQVTTSQETLTVPRLDVAGAVGFNSPSGIIGVEGDYRLVDYLSAGFGVGLGAWGMRLPQ